MKTLLLLLSATTALQAAPKPNIIFIMTDDQGYGDASSYNPESKIPTRGTHQYVRDAIENGRTTPGPKQKNDAKVVIWKDKAGAKKGKP